MKTLLLSKSFFLSVIFAFSCNFSIAQPQWQTVDAANQPNKRSENAFVKIGDKFYLLGGRGIKPIEIYDPATAAWSEGAMPPLPSRSPIFRQ